MHKNKKKQQLETVRETINEISCSRNHSVSKANNTILSSSTEKIDSQQCKENYTKKTKSK